MTLLPEFTAAQAQVQNFKTRPSNEELLELYGWYKQATVGDVQGDKPGMLDLKGRAKYAAWSLRKGTTREAAMQAYVALVARLATRYG